MDETLLHAQGVVDGCSPRPNSCVLQFEYKGELLKVDYVPRPGIFAFLDQLLDKGYELAVFTAAVQPYADAALDSFDPTGRYFGQDRFYRQHMVEEKKDLRAVFGDRLSGGAVLIDDNAHEVLPNDQLDYAVLVDHWRGDEATTAQALASLESAAKALANKLGGGHLGSTCADVDVEDDYGQLAQAAAAAAMADVERGVREAKAAIAETRQRRAASMHAWLAAAASKRCQWDAVKQRQAQALIDVVVDQQAEGCPQPEDLEQAHVEHAIAEDVEQAHDKHAVEDLKQVHVEHVLEDVNQACDKHDVEDLGQAYVEHAAEDVEQAHDKHAAEDIEQADVKHPAEDLVAAPRLRPSRAPRSTRSTFKGRVFSSASSMWRMIGLP